MKSSHYFAIAIRLFSIALFLYGIKQATWLIEVLINGSLNGIGVSVAFLLAISVLPLIFSIIFWSFPLTVSKLIVKSDLDLPVERMPAETILMIVILGIGLFAFYNALVDSIYWVILSNMSGEADASTATLFLSAENRANMWVTGFEVLASVVLVVKARTIAKRMLELAG